MNYMINYFFHTDFSKYGEVIKNYPLGFMNKPDADSLVAIFDELDKGEFRKEWNARDLKIPFNLRYAEITYNGKNSQSWPTKPPKYFSHACCIQLSEEKFDRIWLVYNLPKETPTDEEEPVVEA